MKDMYRIVVLVCLFVILHSCTCSLTDTFDVSDNALLTVTATSEAFAPLDGTVTRASENLYKTEFTNGDQIGITVIKDGKIVDEVNNICFTYNASTKKWEAAAGSPSLFYYPEVTYLAYYPYDAAMSDKMTEQEIIDAFIPQTNQSTYDNYTKSDLMVATGTADRVAKTLSLPFSHKMALVSVSAVTNKFVTSGGYEYTPGEEFAVRNLAETSITIGTQALTPCSFDDGTFRVIVPPDATAQTINIKYKWVELTDFTDQTQQALTSGKYLHYHFKMPESVPYVRDLQVGDFFFSDGRIVPGNLLTLNDPENCIGLLFYVGKHASDSGTYTDKSGAPMDVHGYVIVAAPKVYSCAWGSQETDIPNGVGTSQNTSDFMGYDNTQKIKAKALSKHPELATTSGLSTEAADNYPATYHATISFEQDCPSPVSCSGWFLPSFGQLTAVRSQKDKLTENLVKLGRNNLFNVNDRYTWTSTEYMMSGVNRGKHAYGYNLSSGGQNSAGKGADWYSPIAVLAF